MYNKHTQWVEDGITISVPNASPNQVVRQIKDSLCPKLGITYNPFTLDIGLYDRGQVMQINERYGAIHLRDCTYMYLATAIAKALDIKNIYTG